MAGDIRRRERESANGRHMLMLLALGAVFVTLQIGPLLFRYSSLILLSPSSKRLPLTATAHQRLVETHRFVILGGPHRGGTTLLWQLLAAHAGVASFASSAIDTDFGEGAFLQTVLPTFGVGTEGWGAGQHTVGGGLGRYAFDPASHLTETHRLHSNTSSQQLMEEWGFYWNLSKPTLLEKTPTNSAGRFGSILRSLDSLPAPEHTPSLACRLSRGCVRSNRVCLAAVLTSRLLQALLVAPSPSHGDVSFVFITRHPLAVSLAHRAWPCCGRMSLASLALHWIASHRILSSDLPHLQRAMLLRYEDLARSPTPYLRTLFAWLGLPLSSPALRALIDRASIAPDTNAKYERAYCARHLGTPAGRREHCETANALQPPLDALGTGYDLRYGSANGFGCLDAALRTLTHAAGRGGGGDSGGGGAPLPGASLSASTTEPRSHRHPASTACDAVAATPALVAALREHESWAGSGRRLALFAAH